MFLKSCPLVQSGGSSGGGPTPPPIDPVTVLSLDNFFNPDHLPLGTIGETKPEFSARDGLTNEPVVVEDSAAPTNSDLTTPGAGSGNTEYLGNILTITTGEIVIEWSRCILWGSIQLINATGTITGYLANQQVFQTVITDQGIGSVQTITDEYIIDRLTIMTTRPLGINRIDWSEPEIGVDVEQWDYIVGETTFGCDVWSGTGVAMVVDSNNPPDVQIGTPNSSVGGPGVGVGSGNILNRKMVLCNTNGDTTSTTVLPGTIKWTPYKPVALLSVGFINTTATINMYFEGKLVHVVNVPTAGTNSYQLVKIGYPGIVDEVDFVMTTAGAITNVNYYGRIVPERDFITTEGFAFPNGDSNAETNEFYVTGGTIFDTNTTTNFQWASPHTTFGGNGVGSGGVAGPTQNDMNLGRGLINTVSSESPIPTATAYTITFRGDVIITKLKFLGGEPGVITIGSQPYPLAQYGPNAVKEMNLWAPGNITVESANVLVSMEYILIGSVGICTGNHTISDIIGLQAQIDALQLQINAKPDSLVELSDTTIAGPTNGETLVYNGAQWINQLPDNIYNTDGTISVARAVTLSDNLTISGPNTNLQLGETTGITQLSGNVQSQFGLATSPTTLLGSQYQLSQLSGVGVEYLTVNASGVLARGGIANFYNSDDTLTGNRIVTGGGNDLTFTGIGDLGLSSTTFDLTTTGISSYTASQHNIDGNIELQNPANITQGAAQIQFNGTTLEVGSTTTNLGVNPGTLNLQSPTIVLNQFTGVGTRILSVDAAGQVAAIAGATTLYNGDGTLTGNRTVTGGGNNLTFDGVGDVLFSRGTDVGVGNIISGVSLYLEGNALLTDSRIPMSISNGDNGANAYPNRVRSRQFTLSGLRNNDFRHRVSSQHNPGGSFMQNRIAFACWDPNVDANGDIASQDHLTVSADYIGFNQYGGTKGVTGQTGAAVRNLGITATGIVVERPLLESIYTADGTISANRTVNASDNLVTWTNCHMGIQNSYLDTSLSLSASSSSTVMLNLNNGSIDNGASNQPSTNQVTYSFGNAHTYRHRLLTQHQAGTAFMGNRIVFALWDSENNTGLNELGNKYALTIGDDYIKFDDYTPTKAHEPTVDTGATWKNLQITQTGYVVTGDVPVVAADLDIGGNKITNSAVPTAASDLATKGYVDGLITADTNIYNTNGSLTGARTIDLNSNNLTINRGVLEYIRFQGAGISPQLILNGGTTNAISVLSDMQFNNNQIRNVGAATLTTDAPNLGQVATYSPDYAIVNTLGTESAPSVFNTESFTPSAGNTWNLLFPTTPSQFTTSGPNFVSPFSGTVRFTGNSATYLNVTATITLSVADITQTHSIGLFQGPSVIVPNTITRLDPSANGKFVTITINVVRTAGAGVSNYFVLAHRCNTVSGITVQKLSISCSSEQEF
jgi:hypothetical protein